MPEPAPLSDRLAPLLSGLRRRPDVEAPNLVAVDAADRLLLDSWDERRGGRIPAPGSLVVIGDAYGALTLGALAAGARDVRVFQDPLLGELALAENATHAALASASSAAAGEGSSPEECEKYVFFTDDLARGYRHLDLVPGLVAGASTVLLRLPKSLDALDEIVQLIAAHADPAVEVIAAGMVKHMTVSQNEVLGRGFAEVSAGLARQKARALLARGARQAADAASAGASWPRHASLPDAGLTVSAHGGVFAGAGLDIGTRFLLEHLDRVPERATAIDLGCGTGVLATAYALRHPSARVLATDQSALAVVSARETAALNGVGARVEVRRDDGLSGMADASAELVLLNPPFHNASAVSVDVGRRLIADAARALAPGGELWVVFNSHLRYQSELRRLVGPTREIARNRKFTITASVRR